jgi:hypothetical protein
MREGSGGSPRAGGGWGVGIARLFSWVDADDWVTEMCIFGVRTEEISVDKQKIKDTVRWRHCIHSLN